VAGGGRGKVHSIKTPNEFYNRAVFQRSQLKGFFFAYPHTHFDVAVVERADFEMVKVGVMWYLRKDSSLISDASRIEMGRSRVEVERGGGEFSKAKVC
jgi:hypothetical protein